MKKLASLLTDLCTPMASSKYVCYSLTLWLTREMNFIYVKLATGTVLSCRIKSDLHH